MNTADFLKEQDIRFQLIPHAETHDALRLAATLHVSGHQVAKTVLLRADHAEAYVVAVLPADKTVHFQRAAHVIGSSESYLATETEIAERCPDCEFGVLSPFGSQYGMNTIVDESLTEEEEIVFEGNTHHEAVRMKYEDFRRLEEPLVGNFARKA